MSKRYQEQIIAPYSDGFHEIPSSKTLSMEITVPADGAFKATIERDITSNEFTLLVWFSREPGGPVREPQIGTSKRHVCNAVELMVARDFTDNTAYPIAALNEVTGSGALYINIQNNTGGPNSFEITQM